MPWGFVAPGPGPMAPAGPRLSTGGTRDGHRSSEGIEERRDNLGGDARDRSGDCGSGSIGPGSESVPPCSATAGTKAATAETRCETEAGSSIGLVEEGDGKEEPGGLRLPPAEELPGDLADRPAADPLGPGDRNPMPGEAGQPAAPGADPNAMVVPQWPFVYEMTMASYDGSPLAIRYYPSQQGSSAPVVLLVHDLGPGRSGKDFDDPIKELDGQGLAGHLQQEGYAVFSLDLEATARSPPGFEGPRRSLGCSATFKRRTGS